MDIDDGPITKREGGEDAGPPILPEGPSTLKVILMPLISEQVNELSIKGVSHGVSE